MSFRPTLLLLAALLAGGPAVTRAAAADPVATVRAGVDEVMAVLYTAAPDDRPNSVRLRPVLSRHFSFEDMTRRSIGPGWRRFSPEQQKRAVELFSEVVLRTYADRFEPRERPQIRYLAPITLAATRREVPTEITYLGNTYRVAYRLEQAGDDWRVYDVIIEGVSMIANYRGQFDALIQKGGPDEVLRALEKNLAEVSAPVAAAS